MQAGGWHLSLVCNPNLSIAEKGNVNADVFCVGLNSSTTDGLHQKNNSPLFIIFFFQFASVRHYKAALTPCSIFS